MKTTRTQLFQWEYVRAGMLMNDDSGRIDGTSSHVESGNLEIRIRDSFRPTYSNCFEQLQQLGRMRAQVRLDSTANCPTVVISLSDHGNPGEMTQIAIAS